MTEEKKKKNTITVSKNIIDALKDLDSKLENIEKSNQIDRDIKAVEKHLKTFIILKEHEIIIGNYKMFWSNSYCKIRIVFLNNEDEDYYGENLINSDITIRRQAHVHLVELIELIKKG